MSDSLLTEVTVSINGSTINVAPGTTILEAARSADIEIPCAGPRTSHLQTLVASV